VVERIVEVCDITSQIIGLYTPVGYIFQVFSLAYLRRKISRLTDRYYDMIK